MHRDALISRCSIGTTLDDDSEDEKQARPGYQLPGLRRAPNGREHLRPLKTRGISSARRPGTRFGLRLRGLGSSRAASRRLYPPENVWITLAAKNI